MSDFIRTPSQDSLHQAVEDQSFRTVLPMSFTGSGLDYFLLILKTTLLTLVTFGLYYPWARCERLNYLYRHTRAGYHNLAFHGTGREIAIGYVKGGVIYGAAYALMTVSQSLVSTLPLLAALGVGVATVTFYGLFPIALWGARAYRSSRLSYRGIRFGMQKDGLKPFAVKTFRDIILTLFSFGLYSPFAFYNMTSRLITGTRWGTEGFEFEESRSESVKLSITNLLLNIVSFGLLLPATYIRRTNFTLSKIRFQGMRIHSKLGWGDGYAILLFPLLASTISLGLLFPWATIWAKQYLYSKIRFEGELNLARIMQNQASGNALGETAGSMLDIDMGLGV